MADENILREAGGAFTFLTNEVKGAASAGVAMAGELLNANQKLSDYTSALVGNSKILGNFGKVINGLTKFAEDSLAEYQTLAGIGASFGKEMSQIKISAAELGLNVKDMSDLFMQNSDALRAFGGTTDDAIKNFTRLSKGLLGSQFGTELRRLGFTASDINETLLIYNELAQQDGLNRKLTTQQQIEGARNFAVELDGLAKLTGKQRKDLANEMKEARARGNVQALLMGKTSEQQEAFTRTMTELKNTIGPQYEQLFIEMAQFGAPVSKAAQQAYLTLGSAQNEFEDMVSNAMDPAGLAASVRETQGAFLEYQKTQDSASVALLSGVSDIGDAAALGYESSYKFANAIDASAQELPDGTLESTTQTIERLRRQIADEQLTQMETTGNLLDKTVQMQEALREFTIVATTDVLPRLETMAVQGIDMFLERLPSADQLAAQLTGGVEALMDRLDERVSNNPYVNEIPAGFDNLGVLQQETTDAITASADAVGVGVRESATATTETVSAEVQAAQAVLETAQAEASAARESAEAALSEAQAELAALTNDQFHGSIEAINTAQQRVDAAEATLQTAIDAGNNQVMQAITAANRAAAMSTNAGLPTNAAGATDWRYAPRRAKGGRINSGEVALVGESGAEFVAGPGEVMSAKTSMGVMQNLLKGIKALDENVQSQAQNTATAISNTRDNSNIEKKYDTMIGLLTQLVNVEVDASNTAQRTYRATKGLQGNMIRGLGV